MSPATPLAGGAFGAGAVAPYCDLDVLNALLRGEIAAVETYDRAVAKFDGHPAADELRAIREEHRRAVAALRAKVREFGGQPARGSGTWGAFAVLVTGAARMIGRQAVLSALKQGEEHGVDEYEDALDNPDVPDACRFLIRAELLPKCQQHITTVTRLIGERAAK